MTSAAALPRIPGAAAPALTVRSFRAMAGDVTLTVAEGAPADEALTAARRVFTEVERECTRFAASSDLMRANAAKSWQPVGARCFAALRAAAAAHRSTDGRFDPRVVRALHRIGYGQSLPFAAQDIETAAPTEPAVTCSSPWRPSFDAVAGAVRLGPEPVDLGGIGKGLAVRWAAEQVRPIVAAFVLDAGGDCYLSGSAPTGPWRVGVEDPSGAAEPVAVLEVEDAACATSSIRIRNWRAGGRAVHHLIDPRTGAPGGAGLLAVTVVGPDPAEAEVWSKVLFLSGAAGIHADAGGRAALWTTTDGRTDMTSAMRRYLRWERT